MNHVDKEFAPSKIKREQSVQDNSQTTVVFYNDTIHEDH